MRAVLLATVAAAVVAGAVLTGSEAGTGPATIRITTEATRSARVDVGRRGASPGDLEIFAELLYNRRITPKAIGRAEFVCTATFGGYRICRGTFTLPRGRLVVEGTVRFRQLYHLAVTGGTGLYDNARGSLTVTRTSARPRREIALFRLTG